MRMSIYTKIAQIQKEIGPMTKEKEGYNYKYFDINQILEKLMPLLDKHGLVLTQPIQNVDGIAVLNTIIYDTETQESLHSEFPMPELQDFQKIGSGVTYIRRYSIQSLLALQAEDDDALSTKDPF